MSSMTIKQKLAFQKSWRDQFQVRLILRIFPGSKLVRARGVLERDQEEMFENLLK